MNEELIVEQSGNSNVVDFAKDLNNIDEPGVTFEGKDLLWNTSEDAKDVIAALDPNKKVSFLNLEKNTLGVSAAKEIGKALEKHPEFKKAFWRNIFRRCCNWEDWRTEIPQVLEHLGKGLMVASAQLTVIDLSNNVLGPTGMVGLEGLLRSAVCYSLKELHLDKCALGIDGGCMLSKALLDCHKSSTDVGKPLALKVFTATYNHFKNEGAKALAKVFSTIKTLEDITIPVNRIERDGMIALLEGIKKNVNMRVLNLCGNTVGPKGAALLTAAFAFMPNVKEIHLRGCQLKTNGSYCLSEALVEMHNLEVVDMAHNEIGLVSGVFIASAMRNKPNLRLLNLDGNKFGIVGCAQIKWNMSKAQNPDALASLEEDDGERCKEDSYSEEEEEDDNDQDEYEEDEDLARIISGNVYGANVSNKNTDVLVGNTTTQANYINIEEPGVTFEDKALTWKTSEDAKDVIAALDPNKKVFFLNLGGNTLGVSAAKAIGKALEKHPEFKGAFWRNIFRSCLKTEIPQAIKHLGKGILVASAQLTVIDLSNNALGPTGMVGFKDLLRSAACYSLKELNLHNCALGIDGGHILSNALLDCHKSSTDVGKPLALKVFIAGCNRFKNEGAKALAKIFSTIETLEDIRIPLNNFYHDGITVLAEGFKKNVNLRLLDLNENTVGPKGAASLSSAFAFIPNLREVHLRGCLLKTNGSCCLSESLIEMHNLEVLDLEFNEIGPTSGNRIVSAMRNKPNLRLLNLDSNEFGIEGCAQIKLKMLETKNPDALGSLEEDEGECCEEDGESGEDEETENDDDDDYYLLDDYDDGMSSETSEEDEDLATYLRRINNSGDIYESVVSNKNTKDALGNITTPANSIKAFCTSQKYCTLAMFKSLEEGNSVEAFKKCINQFSDEEHLTVLIFTALKCANLSKMSADALNVAIALFAESFDYAKKTNQPFRLLEICLVHFGFKPREKKAKKNPFHRDSCLYAFRETLNRNLISEEFKNAFTHFLRTYDNRHM